MGVAGPPSRHRPHFNRNEFHPKRLKMRILSMEKSVWLRGFVVKSLGGGVRVSPRLLKIQWICNMPHMILQPHLSISSQGSISFNSTQEPVTQLTIASDPCPRRDGGTRPSLSPSGLSYLASRWEPPSVWCAPECAFLCSKRDSWQCAPAELGAFH